MTARTDDRTHFAPPGSSALDDATLEFCAQLCDGRAATSRDPIRVAEAESIARAIRALTKPDTGESTC